MDAALEDEELDEEEDVDGELVEEDCETECESSDGTTFRSPRLRCHSGMRARGWNVGPARGAASSRFHCAYMAREDMSVCLELDGEEDEVLAGVHAPWCALKSGVSQPSS